MKSQQNATSYTSSYIHAYARTQYHRADREKQWNLCFSTHIWRRIVLPRRWLLAGNQCSCRQILVMHQWQSKSMWHATTCTYIVTTTIAIKTCYVCVYVTGSAGYQAVCGYCNFRCDAATIVGIIGCWLLLPDYLLACLAGLSAWLLDWLPMWLQ